MIGYNIYIYIYVCVCVCVCVCVFVCVCVCVCVCAFVGRNSKQYKRTVCTYKYIIHILLAAFTYCAERWHLKQTVPLKMISCRSKHIAGLSNYFSSTRVRCTCKESIWVRSGTISTLPTNTNKHLANGTVLLDENHASEVFPPRQRDTEQTLFQSASP